MKRDLRSRLTAASAAMMGYDLATGPRLPVDFSVIDEAHRYLNGSHFLLPFNGPSIGTIAPGEIPSDPNLRVGVHLSPRSAIRFCSFKFELHTRSATEPIIEEPQVFNGCFGPVDPEIRDAFMSGNLIENRHQEEELSFSLRVFRTAQLPHQFIVRCPDVEFGGIRFRVKDFAYKYFQDRKAMGLCT